MRLVNVRLWQLTDRELDELAAAREADEPEFACTHPLTDQPHANGPPAPPSRATDTNASQILEQFRERASRLTPRAKSAKSGAHGYLDIGGPSLLSVVRGRFTRLRSAHQPPVSLFRGERRISEWGQARGHAQALQRREPSRLSHHASPRDHSQATS